MTVLGRTFPNRATSRNGEYCPATAISMFNADRFLFAGLSFFEISSVRRTLSLVLKGTHDGKLRLSSTRICYRELRTVRASIWIADCIENKGGYLGNVVLIKINMVLITIQSDRRVKQYTIRSLILSQSFSG